MGIYIFRGVFKCEEHMGFVVVVLQLKVKRFTM